MDTRRMIGATAAMALAAQGTLAQDAEEKMSAHGVELHDPFLMKSGHRVAKPGEWPQRRKELADIVQRVMYGTLPPTPAKIPSIEIIRDARANRGNLQLKIFPFENSDFGFTLHCHMPNPLPKEKMPVILLGDGCWRYDTPEVIEAVRKRGYALLVFNRCEIVPDQPPKNRDTRFQKRFPGSDFGAVAAWAWGFHRVVDVIPQIAELDPARVAVVGHSRGGKASLLAGALDERIAIVASNNSGAGGAGSEFFRGPNSESLDGMLNNFPTWTRVGFEEYRGKWATLPMDSHFLKALCAPRPLLTTEGLGDVWANPAGTWLSHLAAREVYGFLGVENAVGIFFREGGHGHKLEDFETLLDFCDLHFFKKPSDKNFNKPPREGLPEAFKWRKPQTNQPTNTGEPR